MPTLRERFESVICGGWNNLFFSKIAEADRLHPSTTGCAVLKLMSLLKEPAKFEMRGAHDEVYFNEAGDFRMTDDDILYLLRCGVRVVDGRLRISACWED